MNCCTFFLGAAKDGDREGSDGEDMEFEVMDDDTYCEDREKELWDNHDEGSVILPEGNRRAKEIESAQRGLAAATLDLERGQAGGDEGVRRLEAAALRLEVLAASDPKSATLLKNRRGQRQTGEADTTENSPGETGVPSSSSGTSSRQQERERKEAQYTAKLEQEQLDKRRRKKKEKKRRKKLEQQQLEEQAAAAAAAAAAAWGEVGTAGGGEGGARNGSAAEEVYDTAAGTSSLLEGHRREEGGMGTVGNGVDPSRRYRSSRSRGGSGGNIEKYIEMQSEEDSLRIAEEAAVLAATEREAKAMARARQKAAVKAKRKADKEAADKEAANAAKEELRAKLAVIRTSLERGVTVSRRTSRGKFNDRLLQLFVGEILVLESKKGNDTQLNLHDFREAIDHGESEVSLVFEGVEPQVLRITNERLRQSFVFFLENYQEQ